MILDCRLLAICIIAEKIKKKIFTEDVKKEIRNKTITYKFTDYITIKSKNNTKTAYQKDGKIIELNTSEIIQEYCQRNGIEIIKETRKDYTLEPIASQKAIDTFEKMLNELDDCEYKNITKLAEKMKTLI